MLTCDDVRSALPGIESGEPADGAVRDHLASCEACRDVGDHLRAELGVLRRELSALAPSPLLEDAVLDRARDPGHDPVRPGLRASWKPVLLTIAAAVLLVAVLVVPRLDDGGQGTRDGDGDAAVMRLPPTAGMVADARADNPPPPDGGSGYRHAFRAPSKAKGLRSYARESIDPPVEHVHQRWVFKPGERGERTFAMQSAPPRGFAVLGKQILDRLGGEEALRRLRATAARWHVVLASPVEGGPRVSVEVALRPDYTGSVLIEEPLGRALGLHQFEIPGVARVVGIASRSVHRVRARLRLAPAGLPPIDEVLEIQVRGVGDPYAGDVMPGAGESVLWIEGEAPDGADLANRAALADGFDFTRPPASIALTPEIRREAKLPLGRGRRYARLLYGARTRPACTVWLPPLDAGSGYPNRYRFRMRRTELGGRHEPGAEVVVAGVWEGTTAIPSSGAIAVTTVDADGRVSFVHCGPDGEAVRACIRGADGEVQFVDVRPERPPLVVNLLANGRLRIRTLEFDLAAAQPADSFWEQVDAIKAQLSAAVEAEGRDERGYAETSALIHAESATPWRYVQWVMQLCADPGIRIRKLQFELLLRDHAPLAQALPADTGLPGPPIPDVETLKVSFFHDAGRTRVKVSSDVFVLGDGVDDATLTSIAGIVSSRAKAAGRRIQVELVAPPPKGGRTPYEHVWAVLRVVQAAGASDVLFEGAAWPGPRRRR